LEGSILETIEELHETHTQDISDPKCWKATLALGGEDTYVHVRLVHMAYIVELLLDAQLRQPQTAFTVVVPQVGMRLWSKYLKHFRRKETHEVHVTGLGLVKHWLLRFEAGDGLLPRKANSETETEAEVGMGVEGENEEEEVMASMRAWQDEEEGGGRWE
jgi:hypothetical protein